MAALAARFCQAQLLRRLAHFPEEWPPVFRKNATK
jgi:hypothetical protein